MVADEDALRTRIRSLEVALKDSQERGKHLDEAVSSMLEGYQIIDREFRYVYVNEAAARHGQTTVAKLTGRRMQDMYPGIEATEVFQRIRDTLATRKIHYLTNEFQFPTGEKGWFELRIQPVPEGALIFSIDVTDREREKIRNDKLSARLHQIERLDAIGRVTGGIAHDFNNMLTVLMMGLDVLEAGLGQHPGLLDEVGRLRAETGRAARVAQQLLAFSRQKVENCQALNLNDLLRQMEPMLTMLCGGSVAVEFELMENLQSIKIDPGFVEQIVMNLCVNARDAMPGGGKLSLRTRNVFLDQDYLNVHATCPSGNYVVLTVHDTGTGMDTATMQKIFEPFFTTKPEGVGTGLGLATVYGLANQCGGAVEVYSEPGRGTAFKVYFPGNLSAEIVQPPARRSKLVATKKYSVLLVDDEPNLRHLISILLTSSGHEVVSAASSPEAMQLLAADTKFDLLITDMAMPGGSGLDLAAEAVKMSQELRVIICSGNSVENTLLAPFGDKIGMLEKPFSKDKLVETIAALMP